MNNDTTEEIRIINVHPTAEKHIIPLHYHIPCTSCKFDIAQLETDYLQELHIDYFQAKVMKKPITGLLLELYLQCNGAMLLDIFLNKLAA
eukprot:3730109-Ditylum_brightwellii.AAC.1